MLDNSVLELVLEEWSYWNKTPPSTILRSVLEQKLILHSSGIVPYQVTWEKPKPRHGQALEEFYRKYPHALPAVSITRETFEQFLCLGAGLK